MKARQGRGVLAEFVLLEQWRVAGCTGSISARSGVFLVCRWAHPPAPLSSQSLPAQGSGVTWLHCLGVRKKRNFLLVAELELVPSQSSMRFITAWCTKGPCVGACNGGDGVLSLG